MPSGYLFIYGDTSAGIITATALGRLSFLTPKIDSNIAMGSVRRTAQDPAGPWHWDQGSV